MAKCVTEMCNNSVDSEGKMCKECEERKKQKQQRRVLRLQQDYNEIENKLNHPQNGNSFEK